MFLNFTILDKISAIRKALIKSAKKDKQKYPSISCY